MDPFSNMQPYAVCLGIGWILLIGALMKSTSKFGASPDSPTNLEVLMSDGKRALLFPIVVSILPALVAMVAGMSSHLGDWFSTGTKESVYTWLNNAWDAEKNPLDAFGAEASQFLVMLGFLIFSLLLLFELALSQFAGYVLMCLGPPIAALAVTSHAARRVFGGLLAAITGLMLTPAVAWFVQWTGQYWIRDQIKVDGMYGAAIPSLVTVFVSSAVPVSLALVMAWVTGAIGGSGDGAEAARARGESLARQGAYTAQGLMRNSGGGASDGYDGRDAELVDGESGTDPSVITQNQSTASNVADSNTSLNPSTRIDGNPDSTVPTAVGDGATEAASAAATQGAEAVSAEATEVAAEQTAASAAPGVGNAAVAAYQASRLAGEAGERVVDEAQTRVQTGQELSTGGPTWMETGGSEIPPVTSPAPPVSPASPTEPHDGSA